MRFMPVLLLLAMAACALPKASLVHVDKSERRMTLLDHNKKPIRQYKIALGNNPIGHKEQEGDGRTPEGWYKINRKNPDSRFYKSLGVSYPNAADRAAAAAINVPPGGDIVIHGRGPWTPQAKIHGFRGDWTQGCISVQDSEIAEIYRSVSVGTPILIEP